MIQIKLLEAFSSKSLEKAINNFLSSTTNIEILEIHTEVNVFMYSARIVYIVQDSSLNTHYLKKMRLNENNNKR